MTEQQELVNLKTALIEKLELIENHEKAIDMLTSQRDAAYAVIAELKAQLEKMHNEAVAKKGGEYRMILRETRIIECWCPQCFKGQVGHLLEKSFEEKKHLTTYIGTTIVCPKCGAENILEDVIEVTPSDFFISRGRDDAVVFSNNQVAEFVNHNNAKKAAGKKEGQ